MEAVFRFSVLPFNEFVLELGAPISFIPHVVNGEHVAISSCPCLFRLSHCFIWGARGGKIWTQLSLSPECCSPQSSITFSFRKKDYFAPIRPWAKSRTQRDWTVRHNVHGQASQCNEDIESPLPIVLHACHRCVIWCCPPSLIHTF